MSPGQHRCAATSAPPSHHHPAPAPGVDQGGSGRLTRAKHSLIMGRTRKAPGLVARAHRYVTACGFVVAAIDAPGHGDRPRTEQDELFRAGIRERMAAGEPIGPYVAHYNTQLASAPFRSGKPHWTPSRN